MAVDIWAKFSTVTEYIANKSNNAIKLLVSVTVLKFNHLLPHSLSYISGT